MSARRAVLLILALVLAPPADAAEALRHHPHCQQGLFCLTAERHGERISLWLDVETGLPLTLAVHLETRHLAGAPMAPLRLAVTGPVRRRLALLRILAPGDWSLAWDYSFHPGTEPARHDLNAVYRLPFPPGAAPRVIQGAEGPLSHSGPLANAIDWGVPVGTPVLAARAGVVIGLRGTSEVGGPDPALTGRENFVWLRHADGTVGQYLHLQAGSLRVTAGESVMAGRQIGRSGNTGYSTEPHLHFHVSAPTPDGPDAFESFPLRFGPGG